jgi:lipid II:glycine glycyltransferase (peptidoglycan interpeptide bridge formation enzyme)
MIELQRCTDAEAWDNFILDNGGHPLQLWGWGQLKMAHGWTADRLFGYQDDEVVAAIQVLTRKLPMPLRAFSYAPRGPVGQQGSSEEFLDLAASYVKREYHSVALSIEPDTTEFDIPQGWVRAKNTILPNKTIILDLEKTDSDLLAVMDKKTRQYIRKSAAEAITIRQVHSRDELEKCLDVYHQTAHRAHFNVHNDQYYFDVFNLLGEYSPVFAAFVDDQPIAFLWLAISADTAFELYGGMNDQGQTLRANYALKWYAIRKTKEWGLARYDFGGLIGDGVSNFKRSWAQDETELAGTFDKPLSSFYGIWNSGLPAAKKVVRTFKRSKR